MPIEVLRKLVAERAGEQSIQQHLKANLHLLGKSCTWGPVNEEYIALSEMNLSNGPVDFCVLCDRSRMAVVFIEIKGSDFSFLTKSGAVSAQINLAAQQIRKRVDGALSEEFRRKIHILRRDILADRKRFNCAVGAEGLPHVDPEKDIQVRSLVIGGHTLPDRDLEESRERSKLERSNIATRFESWDSWLRRNGEIGGSIKNAAL